jgi:hypothetical protein
VDLEIGQVQREFCAQHALDAQFFGVLMMVL